MTITATCMICGQTETREVDDEAYLKYANGELMLQYAFPDVEPWIRAGGIDLRGNGFCICDKCGG